MGNRYLQDLFLIFSLLEQADKAQRAKDKKAFSEQKSHQMKGRNHAGRGKGRSLFSEVAKGIGLISEHKDNHGRLVGCKHKELYRKHLLKFTVSELGLFFLWFIRLVSLIHGGFNSQKN